MNCSVIYPSRHFKLTSLLNQSFSSSTINNCYPFSSLSVSLIIFFTKGLTILRSNGVEAATAAIAAVLISCGGFGMYFSMNLTSSYKSYTFSFIFASFMPYDTLQSFIVTEAYLTYSLIIFRPRAGRKRRWGWFR